MLNLSFTETKLKVFRLFLLLLVLGYNNGVDAALFDGCDNVIDLSSGGTTLESPNYPSSYTPGSSCRYKYVAPLDYVVTATCDVNFDNVTTSSSNSEIILFSSSTSLSNGGSCSTEFFYVSPDGDLLLGHEYICGSGTFTRTSKFRSLTLAYESQASWGIFRCTLSVSPQACDCGWSVNTKIVGGQTASPNEYPSMVALQDLTTKALYCGATIVSHRFLITAAHCTTVQSNIANIAALVGAQDLTSTTSYSAQYAIGASIPHPEFDATTNQNDIALLWTTTNIEWSRGVGPICLPPSTDSPNSYQNNLVDVIGWGTTAFAGATSNTLQKATLIVIDNESCQSAYSGIANIIASDICTKDQTGSGRDSCQFDSGGPVILRDWRMILVGTISFGQMCGQGGTAIGVNTRITSYLPWIYQNLGTLACGINAIPAPVPPTDSLVFSPL